MAPTVYPPLPESLPDLSDQYHPLVRDLPMMDREAFETFYNNVCQAGRFTDKGKRFEGKILNARHRAIVSAISGIELHYDEFDPVVDGDPWEYVFAQMAHRERDASMKAVEVVLLAESASPAARGEGKVLERLAVRVGVSPKYAEIARTCRNSAPMLWRSLVSGKLKIPVAQRQMQRTAKVAKWSAATTQADDAIALTEETCRILVGDCRVTLDANVRDASVDLIFTDPPYGIGDDYHGFDDAMNGDDRFALYEQTIEACARVLKPNGSLWLMLPSRLHHDGLVAGTNNDLVLLDTIIWAESFGQHNARYFTDSYRVIHHFVKDAKNYTFNANDVRTHVPSWRGENGDARAAGGGLKLPGNVWGVWTDRTVARLVDNAAERVPVDTVKVPNQLPVALVERIVLLGSNPGDVVLDPFHGTGTTAVAALAHGRTYVGCEVSPEVAEASRGWIQARLSLLADKERSRAQA